MIEGRDFAAATTVGARERQEDEWGTYARPPAEESGAVLLAAVADGMGGAPGGDQASRLAMGAFLDSYASVRRPARERMRHALAHANREVGIAVECSPELAGMGCTLVAALFFVDRCEWFSVGDSFVLLCRDARLEQVNPLHTYGNELDERVRRGEISIEEARGDPDRAALTSVVQGGAIPQVAEGTLELEEGDILLLASDGITTLSDEEILRACARDAEDAQKIAADLIGQVDARCRKGQDNATVVVVRQPDYEEATLPLRETMPREE